MLQQLITKVSFDAFRQRTNDKKVVLLYPWTNHRNVFLTYFLNQAKEGLLYYRIPVNESRLSDWLEGLVDEISSVLDGFGSHMKTALAAREGAASFAAALAADLNAIHPSEPVTLYLDELDRLPVDDDFKKFFTTLVNALADNVQIAISSRMLSHEPWYNMVQSGEAIVIGTEYRRNDVIFTVEDKAKPQLEIYSLGRGHVLVNGEPITNWDGALPRNLFFFFIDRPLVTRDEIFETFWPNLSVKEATNVFHVTKRKITERVTLKLTENNDEYELTQYSSGFYMPSNKMVRHYDVSDFQEALEQALVASDDRKEEALYSRAVDLYKAPFLQTINMRWVDDRREHLKSMYSQALIGLGRIHQKRNEYERSLGYFVRALKEAPEREDIHREVMRLYLQLGMVHDARLQYRSLEEILHSTVGISPSKDTRDLYEVVEAQS